MTEKQEKPKSLEPIFGDELNAEIKKEAEGSPPLKEKKEIEKSFEKKSGEKPSVEPTSHNTVKKGVIGGTGKKERGYSPPSEYSFKTFKDVAGLHDLKETLRTEVIYPMQHRELAETYKQRVGSGVLIYGPPGCGKTYIAQAIAGEIGWPLINASCGNLIGRWAGQTEDNIHAVFEDAREQAKKLGGVILFFDEIDALGMKRQDVGDGASKWRQFITDTLLNELDGVSSNENVFVIGATNAPWEVDPSLKRPGRFSESVFVPPPDHETRKELFRIYTTGLPIQQEIDFEKLASKTEWYGSSDITEICDTAAEIPWKETIKTGEKRNLTIEDFENAIAKTKSSLSEWYTMVDNMKFSKKFNTFFPELADSVSKYNKYRKEGKPKDFEGYR